MGKSHGVEERDDSITVGVMEIPGEPAVVVNGVPDPSPEFSNDTEAGRLVTDSVSESIEFYGQGEWLKGRKVLKKFGKKYYKGKVKNYDPETNWYKVVYEDGDSEEMEFCELQMVMVPLDIKSPLKTWLLKLAKFNTPKERTEKKKENSMKAKRAEMKKKTKGSGPHCASLRKDTALAISDN